MVKTFYYLFNDILGALNYGLYISLLKNETMRDHQCDIRDIARWSRAQ